MAVVYRNKKLLALAKDAPRCFGCGNHNYGQVVAAHANRQDMGKGVGIKAADIPAFLCGECHDQYDGRIKSDLSKEDRESEWNRAALLSMRWVLENRSDVFSV